MGSLHGKQHTQEFPGISGEDESMYPMELKKEHHIWSCCQRMVGAKEHHIWVVVLGVAICQPCNA